MIKEAIILAGGLGTRLKSAVPDLPKCMAPVNGRPFLDYVIETLSNAGIEHFIFSLGYMHEYIEAHLTAAHKHLNYDINLEDEPLGTGGAIHASLKFLKSPQVIITNGDTLFKINLQSFSDFHISQQSICSLGLKPMRHFDRYGVVKLNKDHQIASFKEKQPYQEGLINGGVYALDAKEFLQLSFPEKFSFEKDFLERYYQSHKMSGMISDAYFIDIGIPEDYARASTELKSPD
jgi:D-glycero-alpha-D-manno-heptose 1-phosphate guanylyltransferase